MKKLLMCLTLSVIIVPSTVACSCDFGEMSFEEVFEMNFQENSLIFIARPVRSVDSDFRLEVIEVLKGNLETKYIDGEANDSCHESPSSKPWIVYTNKNDNGTISIFSCSLSRPLDDWLSIKGFYTRHKKLENELDHIVEELKLSTLAKYKSILQLQKEIAELRSRRDN